MADTKLNRVPAATAAEVCRRFNIPEGLKGFLRDDQTPGQFVATLLELYQFPTAIDFLAHALPAREAVWWACLCAEEAGGPDQPAATMAAHEAAVQWVLDPTEEHRRAAGEAGEAAGLGSPAGCAARAASWTGGSLIAPNLPVVAPDPGMTPQAVAGGVQLAATLGDPLQIPNVQRRFVELGVGVGAGLFVWPDVKKKPGV